ncbi:unnamed protein product [Urochloa humidicola]
MGRSVPGVEIAAVVTALPSPLRAAPARPFIHSDPAAPSPWLAPPALPRLHPRPVPRPAIHPPLGESSSPMLFSSMSHPMLFSSMSYRMLFSSMSHGSLPETSLSSYVLSVSKASALLAFGLPPDLPPCVPLSASPLAK